MSSVSLAEQAQGYLEAGDFQNALVCLRDAITAASAGASLPSGDDGQDDQCWLPYWEGACMALDYVGKWKQSVWVVSREPMHSFWSFVRTLLHLHRARWVLSHLHHSSH